MVVDETLPNFKEAVRLPVGTAVRVAGELVESPGASQPFELRGEKVEVVGTVAPGYPLQKKRHSFEYLRTIAHLRPRTNTFGLSSACVPWPPKAIHNFFQERGFIYIHTPIITASDCEGAGSAFSGSTIDLADPPRDEEGKLTTVKIFLASGPS